MNLKRKLSLQQKKAMCKKINKDIYLKALDYLALREHGTNELVQKLKKKFDSSIEIQEVIDHLIIKKYLDEKKAIKLYCENLYKKSYGETYIKNKLAQKGFNSTDTYEVLQELNLNFFENCMSFCTKKHLEFTPKHLAKLQRRGFSYNTAKECLNSLQSSMD